MSLDHFVFLYNVNTNKFLCPPFSVYMGALESYHFLWHTFQQRIFYMNLDQVNWNFIIQKLVFDISLNLNLNTWDLELWAAEASWPISWKQIKDANIPNSSFNQENKYQPNIIVLRFSRSFHFNQRIKVLTKCNTKQMPIKNANIFNSSIKEANSFPIVYLNGLFIFQGFLLSQWKKEYPCNISNYFILNTFNGNLVSSACQDMSKLLISWKPIYKQHWRFSFFRVDLSRILYQQYLSFNLIKRQYWLAW